MRNRKGFTLLELLIAATIVGILTIYATISYRNSGADIRLAGAKARTDMLAGGVQRFRLDHPGILFSGAMTNESVSCDLSADSPTINQLAACGYLETGGWADEYFAFYVCNGKTGDCLNSQQEDPLACMTGRDYSRLPNHYRGTKGYIYCVGATWKQETLGSED